MYEIITTDYFATYATTPILVTYCRSLRYLIPVNKKHGLEEKFSIRSWLQDKSNKGWLFITCREEEKEVLKPLISVWLDTAVSVMMSMPVDYTGRTWLIYDEVASLQKLPSLSTGLAEIRKFGGCMVLGMQSFAQLEEIYGQKSAQAIFSLLNTRLYFKSPDADTARLVSAELGEQDVEEARENYSYGTESVRDGISLGVQRVTRRLVDYSEVLILEELEFYLRLIGDLPVTKVKLLRNVTRPVTAPAFIEINAPEKGEVEIHIDQIEANVGSGHTLEQIEGIINRKKTEGLAEEAAVSAPKEETVPKEKDEGGFESVVAPDPDVEAHAFKAAKRPAVKKKDPVKKKKRSSKKTKKPTESKASKKETVSTGEEVQLEKPGKAKGVIPDEKIKKEKTKSNATQKVDFENEVGIKDEAYLDHI